MVSVLAAGLSPGNLLQMQILMTLWSSFVFEQASPGDSEECWNLRTTRLEGHEVLLYLCPMELWDQSPVTEAGSHPTLKDSLLRVSLGRDRALASLSVTRSSSCFKTEPREEELQVMRFSRVRAQGCQGSSWHQEYWVRTYSGTWYLADRGTLPFLSLQWSSPIWDRTTSIF